VQAGEKDVAHPGQIVQGFRAHSDDLAEPGTYRELIFGLAVHLTGIASDAAFRILVDIVFAHGFSSDDKTMPTLF
jgi:hypothetical protein